MESSFLYNIYRWLGKYTGFAPAAYPVMSHNYAIAGFDGDSLSIRESLAAKSTATIYGKEEVISMERVSVKKGQNVWVGNIPYEIVSAAGDIVIDAIDVDEDNSGNYSAMRPDEFFSQYTYVESAGWVPAPRYKVGNTKSGTRVKGHVLCDGKDYPIWAYVVQKGDEKPQLLTEEQMKAEAKDDLAGTWVKYQKQVLYVSKVNTQSITAKSCHGQGAVIVNIPIDDKIEVITQPVHTIGDALRGSTIKSIQHSDAGWIYVMDNYTTTLEKHT